MKQVRSVAATLPHVVLLPEIAGENFPTIIAIHGRGADENDLIPVVRALGLSNVVFVTPRAPFAFPFGGYAWYDLAQEGMPDQETFQTSLKLLQKFVGEVKAAYPIDQERLMLLGFSQGTVMAYATALLEPSRFRAIAALSGYIPQRSGLPLQLRKLTGFPVFVSHGSNDPLIPLRLGRESVELLKRAGAAVTYHEYPMGHEVTVEVIRELREWTRMVLLPS
jgi:phospholipase/carboxylesterase